MESMLGNTSESDLHLSRNPTKLPLNWTCLFDHTHQSYYYYNDISGLSQWEPPVSTTITASPSNKLPNSPVSELISNSEMPSYMLQNQAKSETLGLSQMQSSSPLLDANDHYSDMDDGDDVYEYGLYTSDSQLMMPTFDSFTEDNRRELPNGRSKDSKIVGGTNQDYLHMARMYKTHRLYSDWKRTEKCVLCYKNNSTHVLFPCEHRCLCVECIEKEEICADSKLSKLNHGHCNCPLCATIIKKILPFDNGKEVEKYWLWVYEIPPPLSKEFLRNWKHSAGVIETVFVLKDSKDDRDRDSVSTSSTISGACVIS